MTGDMVKMGFFQFSKFKIQPSFFVAMEPELEDLVGILR